MKTDPDHTAFPADYQWTSGLTKREYFAAAALTGLATNPDSSIDGDAAAAREMADALIAALNRPPSKP